MMNKNETTPKASSPLPCPTRPQPHLAGPRLAPPRHIGRWQEGQHKESIPHYEKKRKKHTAYHLQEKINMPSNNSHLTYTDQAAYAFIGLPIHALQAQRDSYEVYPQCQRDYVWKLPMKQKLIDSILRGLPIPPITMMVGASSLVGPRYWLVDGQQRVKTILSYIDGKFKTAPARRSSGARAVDEPGMTVIEPDRYFHELTEWAQGRILYYELQICKVHNLPEEWLGLVFRRLNYQVKLSYAERLFSYGGKTQEVYRQLEAHPFFHSFYNGRNDRKQVYQSVLMLCMMELMEIFCNMTSPRLLDLASGQKDDEINNRLVQRIEQNLNRAMRLYEGVTMESLRAVIPIYQSVLLLEQDGLAFEQSRPGALQAWYIDIRAEDRSASNIYGVTDIFTVLTRVNKQYEFWQKHLPTIRKTEGLIFRDSRRAFNSAERIAAWIRQKGKCPECGKPVRITDHAHHIELHSNGGVTNADNCVIMHKACHNALHGRLIK